MSRKNHADVLVVGGGINGVSTAFHLAQAGLRVILLEKDDIAAGPTGHSGAIIRQHYSHEVTARMALESLRFWENFADITGGGDAGFRRTGFLLAVRPEDVEGLKANLELQKRVGIRTFFVPPEELTRYFPYMDPHQLGGAAYEPDAGYCAPVLAATSLARAARARGTHIHTGHRVTGFLTQGQRVLGVQTPLGDFYADRIVLATGPWSPGVLRLLGVEVNITPIRVKVVLFRRPANLEDHPIYGDFVYAFYMRPETGHQTFMGSLDPAEAEDVVPDPDHFDRRVPMDILNEYGEKLVRRFPAMAEGRVSSSYAALYDVTPDWHPVVDRVPGWDNVYLLAGGSGHCFKLSPALGRRMAHLVMHDRWVDDEPHLFTFDRFEKGAQVRGQYAYSILG